MLDSLVSKREVRESSVTRIAVRLAFAFAFVPALTLASACGESSKSSDSRDDGGSGGTSSGGTSSGGTSSGGMSSGGTNAGGASNGGTATGGANGGGASTGGSSTGGGSNGPCGEVTMNGRCVGNVYEWCDWFTGGIRTLDCDTVGMTCVAAERLTYENDINGCVGAPCTFGDPARCEGSIRFNCDKSEIHATDCRKAGGPDSVCIVDEGSPTAGCTRPSCDPPGATCDGDVVLGCNEDGELHVTDCGRCDPLGTCVVDEAGSHCDLPTFGCPE
jgi:hypothetical protein